MQRWISCLMMGVMMTQKIDKLSAFVNRLNRIGVNVELVGNYPWVYIDKINGKEVEEKFRGNHGFTLAFLPIKPDTDTEFTDISEIFKLIRKYTQHND